MMFRAGRSVWETSQTKVLKQLLMLSLSEGGRFLPCPQSLPGLACFVSLQPGSAQRPPPQLARRRHQPGLGRGRPHPTGLGAQLWAEALLSVIM